MTTTMTEIEFKKLPWDATVKLRGSLYAAEYKKPMLGLVFFKYVSDIFEVQVFENRLSPRDFFGTILAH